MSKKISILIVIIFSVFMTTRAKATDKTLEDKANGHDVVEAVIKKIRESGIFPDDKGFLKRVAYVESKFGEESNTFRKGYFGGIWQVDAGATGGFTEITANRHNHQNLDKKIIPLIEDRFGIDWTKVTYQHLLKPFYSGLAARMVLYIRTQPIPDYSELEAQAKYWKDYYNSAEGKGSQQKFINDVKEMEKRYNCRGRMDLCIVLDGSGSIGTPNFELAKQSVADLIGTFSTDQVYIAVIVYSTDSTVVFGFDNRLNQRQMRDEVLNAKYPDSGTNTKGAILKAIELLLKVEHRDGSPRIMTIFTDGRPDNPVDSAVISAQENNITIFAVGIGSNIDQGELMKMTGHEGSRVQSMASYEALTNSFNLMNSETCKVPQKPLIGQTIVDVLAQFEKRYFDFQVPPEGITVSIDDNEGQTKGYYSYTDENPNSALHQGWFVKQVYITVPDSHRHKREASGESKVFVAVEGIELSNNYTIGSEPGNHVSSSCSIKSHCICQMFVLLFAFKWFSIL